MTAAVALALGGTVLFGALHALLIEPIWLRLFGGLPFALLAAFALVWCYSELLAAGRVSAGLLEGALFGALVWTALLPMTLVALFLRNAGLRQRLGNIEVVLELMVAAATGGFIALALTRRFRPALASACCMVAVVLAMAGPIAVGQGPTHRLLLVGFLPIFLLAGFALASLLNHGDSNNAPRTRGGSSE